MSKNTPQNTPKNTPKKLQKKGWKERDDMVHNDAKVAVPWTHLPPGLAQQRVPGAQPASAVQLAGPVNEVDFHFIFPRIWSVGRIRIRIATATRYAGTAAPKNKGG